MFPAIHRSPNELQSTLIFEELTRNGVTDCCLAPGSRSAPLVFAADAQHRLRLHHHFDERGLGFLALGISKAQQRPVAIITTSGSAVANLYPALIEAALSGARLILLTADRPPRLHDCGANQAIDQIGIFANYPAHSLYLPPPTDELPVSQLLDQLSDALDTQRRAGGVVHINCMFDEPLYPSGAAIDLSPVLTPLKSWLGCDRPWRGSHSAVFSERPKPDDWARFSAVPGIIVAGRIECETDALAVANLAKALGWPLLCDIQSQLRGHPDSLEYSDLLLCQDSALDLLQQTRHLLQFGDRLVSKRLQELVDSHPWHQFWLVHPGDTPRAPGRNQHRFYSSSPCHWCHGLRVSTTAASTINASLANINQALGWRLGAHFGNPPDQNQLSEPALVNRLGRLLPHSHNLFAGNSLSIRLLDQLSGALPARVRVLANRGTSGIDGLLATAAGVARASEGGTTLLIGDTSLLYDLNSLALLRGELPLVVLVLNNDGGAIFNTLPIEDSALRQRHFRCPQRLQFEQASAQFSVAYRRVDSLDQFEQDYRAALDSPTPTLIEIPCDGEETATQLRRLASPDYLTNPQ
ncbi:2-succinyl-5-enolpyruvyl-6-hydroxy-3-cyclohexene-1-carboxylic-acid synthase [Aestuariirhabdus sp. LZHN29]|uniref:2-succinyl-5-enolpyruvyl-6-hydroxy-3- cyclohexene-1-carboxylic-acid synthase n=1 Tax=Aestuariirhabdus sp. LZHN29 TaxID=3417462 RepID=UPI003CF016CE